MIPKPTRCHQLFLRPQKVLSACCFSEDDSINQEITKGIMAVLGCGIDVVGNGHEALQALTESDYSLVLMDCQMTETDGFEATAIIRDPLSQVRNHEVPVIALTGNTFKSDR